MRTTMTAAVAAMVLHSSLAVAGPTAAQKCEGGKNDASGKYASCLAKAEKSLVSGGSLDAYDAAQFKCTEKYSGSWSKLETAGSCPSTGDESSIQTFVDACVQSVAVALSAGGTLGPDPLSCASDLTVCDDDLVACDGDLTACQTAPACGNAVVEAGEDCDVGNLDGETCITQGFPGGTLACDFCAFDTSGCIAGRFDSSGPTILDRETGLEWEKKDGSDGVAAYGNRQDVDNAYTWTNDTTAANGTAFSDFLAEMNGVADGTCYLGHCDWRLPTIEELESIAALDCGASPCVADAAFLPNRSDFYWSSQTDQALATSAGGVDLTDGHSDTSGKVYGHYVRAVRDGIGGARVLETGQTTCWDPADTTDPIATIPCAGSGQDGETRKGVAFNYTDNGDGTITDNNTGLMWEKQDDSNLGGLAGIHDRSNIYTWANAFVKISDLNGIVFAGHSDWRLPNRRELETLVDEGRVLPSIDPAFHTSCTAGCTILTCSCTRSNHHWSSTTIEADPDVAWLVSFSYGFTGYFNKTTTYSVRAVRAGS